MIKVAVRKKLSGAQGEMLLDVDLSFETGEFIALTGDSGAGKTSILRMIAGLMTPNSGLINVNGSTWYDDHRKVNLSTQKRKVGMVFQQYALFPNMNVRDNLIFALEKDQKKLIVDELLEIMELSELSKSRPNVLSGGQQQRVALARALVRRPNILLLDEPLSALDQTIRLKLQDHIRSLHDRYELTTILVSHDQSEIVRLADELVEINKGRIVKRGIPEQILFGSNLDNSQLNGTILQVNKIEGTAKVLIGQNVVNIVTNSRVGSELIVGNKVVVNFRGDKLRIES